MSKWQQYWATRFSAHVRHLTAFSLSSWMEVQIANNIHCHLRSIVLKSYIRCVSILSFILHTCLIWIYALMKSTVNQLKPRKMFEFTCLKTERSFCNAWGIVLSKIPHAFGFREIFFSCLRCRNCRWQCGHWRVVVPWGWPPLPLPQFSEENTPPSST